MPVVAVAGFGPPRRPTTAASGCRIAAGLFLGRMLSALVGEVVEVAG